MCLFLRLPCFFVYRYFWFVSLLWMQEIHSCLTSWYFLFLKQFSSKYPYDHCLIHLCRHMSNSSSLKNVLPWPHMWHPVQEQQPFPESLLSYPGLSCFTIDVNTLYASFYTYSYTRIYMLREREREMNSLLGSLLDLSQ